MLGPPLPPFERDFKVAERNMHGILSATYKHDGCAVAFMYRPVLWTRPHHAQNSMYIYISHLHRYISRAAVSVLRVVDQGDSPRTSSCNKTWSPNDCVGRHFTISESCYDGGRGWYLGPCSSTRFHLKSSLKALTVLQAHHECLRSSDAHVSPFFR